MLLGQSLIVGFMASEVVGYIAERNKVSTENIRLTKCCVGVSVGTVTAIVTADPVGAIGAVVLGAAYLGGYDPLYLVTEAIDSIMASKSRS